MLKTALVAVALAGALGCSPSVDSGASSTAATPGTDDPDAIVELDLPVWSDGFAFDGTNVYARTRNLIEPYQWKVHRIPLDGSPAVVVRSLGEASLGALTSRDGPVFWSESDGRVWSATGDDAAPVFELPPTTLQWLADGERVVWEQSDPPGVFQRTPSGGTSKVGDATPRFLVARGGRTLGYEYEGSILELGGGTSTVVRTASQLLGVDTSGATLYWYFDSNTGGDAFVAATPLLYAPLDGSAAPTELFRVSAFRAEADGIYFTAYSGSARLSAKADLDSAPEDIWSPEDEGGSIDWFATTPASPYVIAHRIGSDPLTRSKLVRIPKSPTH